MPGKSCPVHILLLTVTSACLSAQLPAGGSTQDVEDLLYRCESTVNPEILWDDFNSSGDQAMDLNLASREELETSGLFTSYQIENLLDYRTTFGPIYSIHELAVLPGFQHTDLQEMEAAILVRPDRIPSGKFRMVHRILMDAGSSLPPGDEYRPDPESGAERKFAGSPIHATFRWRSRVRRDLTLALTYDKDAGEPYLYRNRPQFISGYISYEGKKLIKQCVIGNFQLNQGLGLVNGSGLFHRAGDFRVNRQTLSRIRPYASKAETGFERGMACRLGFDRFQLLVWGSYQTFSLAPSTLSEQPSGDGWFDAQRTSGLYRTQGELAGRELAFRIHSGIQLLLKTGHSALGIQNGTEYLGPTSRAMDNPLVKKAASIQQKCSLHGYWSKQKIQVFGELSASQYRYPAFLFGMEYQFNDYIHGSILVHHYGSEFSGSLPSSYSSGSRIRNEQGLAFHLHVETGPWITARLTGELFRYPMPRYMTQVPSAGYRLDLSLQSPGTHTLQWKARLVRKAWQATPADESSAVRTLQDFRVSRLDGQWTYTHQDRFRWHGRLVVGYLTEKEPPVPGYAAVQRVSVGSHGKLSITAQHVIFHVTDWENRIYLYEPGFYYSFSFPVCYGTGQRTTFLVTFKPATWLTISVKVTGENTKGESNWETGAQLRLTL
jgi:hypothetical protein